MELKITVVRKMEKHYCSHTVLLLLSIYVRQGCNWGGGACSVLH